MANIKLDLNGFKHKSSNDKSTTLKHEKLGHTVTLYHNVLSPENQTILKAMVGKDAEQPDYGKVIRKADGGKVPIPSNPNQGALDKQKRASDMSKVEKQGSDQSQSSKAMDYVTNPMSLVSTVANSWAKGGKIKMAEGGEASLAYDAGLPCLNPHCKSHGKPHPNCRCYSTKEMLADGGEVSKLSYWVPGMHHKLRYCALGMPHKEGCEYISKQDTKSFADGGKVHKKPTLGQLIAETHAAIPDSQQPLPIPGGGVSPQSAQVNNDQQDQNPQLNQLSPENTNVEESNQVQPSQNSPQQDQSQDQQSDQNAASIDQSPQPDNNAASLDQSSKNSPAPIDQPVNQATLGQLLPSKMAEPDYSNLPATLAARYRQENQAFQQDLNNGHITPKTYNDLMYYNKDGTEKSTLGKIGSLFGMLVSGAGSGLAHQPNAVLEQMNQTIQRDLDAQARSKDNAMNLVKLNQARILQQAQIPKLLAEGKLTNAEAAIAYQDAKMKAMTNSRMQMNNIAAHKLKTDLDKLQPGTPAYQQAATAYMHVLNSVDAMNANLGDKAAVTSAAYAGLGNPQNLQKIAALSGDPQLIARANQISNRTIPGIKGEATRDIPEGTQQQITAQQVLDDKIKDVMSAANKYRGLQPTTQKNREILNGINQKVAELGAFYNKSVDTLGMTPGRLDWIDKQIKKDPQGLMNQFLGNMGTLKEIRDSNANRRDMQLKSFGLQPSGNPLSNRSKSSLPPEGTTGVYNGKPVIVKNGKWVTK
jgi:hypothetical protein